MDARDLKSLKINLASPEKIMNWSYGEVLKPETINYRRLRPEKDGLFCEAIFGPQRDWQCYCGKYKNIRYKGIVCDKCGVEVTRSSVRRERMGHISLAAPVAHVWYTRRVPSYLGQLLDISRKNLDRVLYFAQYIITYVDEDAREKALLRMDEEIADLDANASTNTQQKIDALLANRDTRILDLETQYADIETRYDEELATKLDPIIKEGQRIEAKLQEDNGTTPRKDVVFTETGDVLVSAGEEITNKHIASVQEVVKKYLAGLEKEGTGSKQRELEHLKLNMASANAETDLAISEMKSNSEEENTQIRAEKLALRDELLDLTLIDFMGETRYRELRSRWGQVFKADMGAEAFFDILKRLDLNKMAEELREELATTRSVQKKKKAIKRLKVVEAFLRSGNKPEWMIITVLPVIPPDLRPMVQLDGGRFATSDLNDLYRRVINRNNRLKRLLELGAPDVIVRNEKRMLQEAVDSLIDNSQRGKVLSRRGRRELKSLSDLLKGKKGRFRRNLLGKRVDYSGRSVIVVGPKLKLHQCGLPKVMALELFRPFVISKLVKQQYAANVKGARRFIERGRPEVWEVLEEVMKDRPVLLNRAPTLHRLGIQAFEPIMIEGSAIQLHPLVTTAFNADFDGDQMAVHIPLSEKAVNEARTLMLSSRNLLKPADGEPIVGPSKDMVLGVFYLTMNVSRKHKGDGRTFSNLDEVISAYQTDQLHVHTAIKLLTTTWYDENHVRMEEPVTKLIDTTAGRAIFNNILAPEVQFVNRELDKGGVKDLIAEIFEVLDEETTTDVADKIKDIGFEFATRSGITIAISDITIPEEKEGILAESMQSEALVERDFSRGLLTTQEKKDRVIEIWQTATETISNAVQENFDPNSNLAIMANSGAGKGGFRTISQLAGMRGMMADPAGRIIPLPIRSNFREGLTALEYFISTHGSRKGLADTALRTADAGYLTRRLVDVAQDIITLENDCGTEEGITLNRNENVAGQDFSNRIFGRIPGKHIADPETGEILVEKNQLLDNKLTVLVDESGIQEVFLRSPLTCESKRGVCIMCYGQDLGRGKLVDFGAAVGIIAAQSIGEPGTQLTLRTFHTGGVAGTTDITTGLPRVEELFEARKTPKGEAMVSEISGVADISKSEKYTDIWVVNVSNSEMVNDEYEIAEGWELHIEDATEIETGTIIAKQGKTKITAINGGKVRVEGNKVIIAYEAIEQEDYEIPTNSRIIVKAGEQIEPGQALTEGSLNPNSILRIQGREECQKYLLAEVQQVYRSQGQNIHDKHFEVIIRKMMSKVKITGSGDSSVLPDDYRDRLEILKLNEGLLAEGKDPIKFVDELLGITKSSLNTESFLSAASFQHTIKVLAGAAISGAEDKLLGLKENVIIGKLIPAGTGYKALQDSLLATKQKEKEAAALALEADLPIAALPEETETVTEDKEESVDPTAD
jgi:DNA-directed RNA polymerase subunit beta'